MQPLEVGERLSVAHPNPPGQRTHPNEDDIHLHNTHAKDDGRNIRHTTHKCDDITWDALKREKKEEKKTCLPDGHLVEHQGDDSTEPIGHTKLVDECPWPLPQQKAKER